MKPILGILLGDASGIGPEIVAKLCFNNRLKLHCKPVLIGDFRVLNVELKKLRLDFPINVIDDISQANWNSGIPFLNQKNMDPMNIKLGQIDENSGRATGETFETALKLVKQGDIAGFTFAPYNKAALKYGGYDIYKLFANYLKVKWPFGEINVLNDIWISKVTSHIPFKDVSKRLNVKNIVGAIKLAHDTMLLGGIVEPQIAVAALNPHGGEDGLYGNEEIEIIGPAVKVAQDEGLNAFGPFPADTLFYNAFKGLYNGITTMYHDQGQIALKVKGFESGVTVVAGLSCPITTPAHGTAFDIVGKGIANTNAMERAIMVAAKMASQEYSIY